MSAEPSSVARPGNDQSHATWLLITVGLSILIRLIVAWVSIPTLIEKTIPDDAFYYFSIARHAALDGSISVDGLTVTNGFHPLWLILISPFYLLPYHDPDLPVHLALTLGAVLDTVTVVLAYGFVRLVTRSSSAALGSAVVYGLNPRAVLYAANGLETALNVCLFALFLYAYAEIRSRGGSVARYLYMGAVGGLLLLSRTDNIFILSVVFLHATWAASRRGELRRLVASQALVACLGAPWLVWNYSTFGTIMQTSAVAVPLAFRELYPVAPGSPPITVLVASLGKLLNTSQWLTDASWTGLPPLVGLPLWIAVGLAVVRSWSATKRPHDYGDGLTLVGLAMLAYVLLLLSHLTIRQYTRSWYFAPQAWVFAALVGFSLHYSRTRPPGILWKYRRLAVLAIAETFVLVGVFWWGRGLYRWQVELYEAALWLRANTPLDTRIGSFNAGLHAYYSGRVVINLDGTVNCAALKAIKDKTLLDYMRSMQVEYVSDYDAAIRLIYAPFCGRAPPLELVHVVDRKGVSWQDSAVHIYRLLDRD
jgi:4-amino-4-deoxy-L-arabinose transferase-like glycosyltransferase